MQTRTHLLAYLRTRPPPPSPDPREDAESSLFQTLLTNVALQSGIDKGFGLQLHAFSGRPCTAQTMNPEDQTPKSYKPVTRTPAIHPLGKQDSNDPQTFQP